MNYQKRIYLHIYIIYGTEHGYLGIFNLKTEENKQCVAGDSEINKVIILIDDSYAVGFVNGDVKFFNKNLELIPSHNKILRCKLVEKISEGLLVQDEYAGVVYA